MVETFLSDQSKYEKTTVKDDEFFNFITSQEKRIDRIYERLVDFKSPARRNTKKSETSKN